MPRNEHTVVVGYGVVASTGEPHCWRAPATQWALLPTLDEHSRAMMDTQRSGPTNRQQCLFGALNALTGQVDYRDNYLVGRQQVIACSRQLDGVYAKAERVYVGSLTSAR